MKILARKFEALRIGWNEAPFTENDFYRLCRRVKIKPIEMPLRVPGFYMVCGGKRFIYLDSRLRGLRWLHTALHELGHYYLHAPAATATASFFKLKPNSKDEFEAEVFAVVALLPEPKLRRLLSDEIEDEYMKELMAFRLRVLDTYGV